MRKGTHGVQFMDLILSIHQYCTSCLRQLCARKKNRNMNNLFLRFILMRAMYWMYWILLTETHLKIQILKQITRYAQIASAKNVQNCVRRSDVAENDQNEQPNIKSSYLICSSCFILLFIIKFIFCVLFIKYFRVVNDFKLAPLIVVILAALHHKLYKKTSVLLWFVVCVPTLANARQYATVRINSK